MIWISMVSYACAILSLPRNVLMILEDGILSVIMIKYVFCEGVD